MPNVYGDTEEEIAAAQDAAHQTALAKWQTEYDEWRARVDRWTATPFYLRKTEELPSTGPVKPRHPDPAKR